MAPRLSNPTIVNIPTSDGIRIRLDADEDARLVWPDAPVQGGPVLIEGGRNVVSVGGYITNGATNDGTIIVQSPHRDSHYYFEGLHVDVNEQITDIFAFRNQNGVQYSTTIMNSRLGTPDYIGSGFHGDVVQIQNGSGRGGIDLAVENVTASAEVQAFFLPDRATGTVRVDMENVNTSFADPYTGSNRGVLYWFNNDTSRNEPYPVELDNVYAETDVPWEAVTPQRRHGAIYNDDSVSFSRGSQIDGEVFLGRPATGDFAPANRVGLNYDPAFFGSSGGTTAAAPAPAPSQPAPSPTPAPAPFGDDLVLELSGKFFRDGSYALPMIDVLVGSTLVGRDIELDALEPAQLTVGLDVPDGADRSTISIVTKNDSGPQTTVVHAITLDGVAIDPDDAIRGVRGDGWYSPPGEDLVRLVHNEVYVFDSDVLL